MFVWPLSKSAMAVASGPDAWLKRPITETDTDNWSSSRVCVCVCGGGQSEKRIQQHCLCSVGVWLTVLFHS